MKRETLYLTIAEVLEIHRQLINEFGGLHGVRDAGLLASAVFRPQTGYYEDFIHQAAALMESLANNHAFLDGNKRVAFASVDVFLRLNGYALEVDPLEAHKFITEKIAAREFRVAAILKWLKSCVHPIADEER
ncbi:MAG TPA: type II toxin-antitoxin system death-on-curing family toxin [Candidatus Dormibacteraeota bacterium]|nr:type II toxin-antitoxin system death-on-curing family toxin [Candidatus Dormibacteraeota bacterium]